MHCKDIRKSVLEKSLKEDLSFREAFLEGAFTVPGDGRIGIKDDKNNDDFDDLIVSLDLHFL